MADHLILVGMMGAGKTTVGRQVAERLGWAYLDSDAEVEAATGSTVPELLVARGEAVFRSEESRVLAEALARTDPVVVSAAGGTVLSEENRRLLSRSGRVVWLRAEPSTLTARVGDGTGRPLLGDDPATALAELDEVRRPFYAAVADVVVDVDGLPTGEVVDRVLAAARAGGGTA